MAAAEVLRPGPVVGTGHRVQMLQNATLATRLSNFASVAAALLRTLSTRDVDPSRLSSQRARAREFVTVIRELESSDVSHMYETSELIPRKIWVKVRESLDMPSDLDQVLTRLLDAVDEGTYDKAELSLQAGVMGRLADSLQALGREGLHAATENPRENETAQLT